MLGTIIVYGIVTVLSVLVVSPQYFTFAYFLTRPLLQPFAMEKMLVFGVPLTGLMALQLAAFTVIWLFLRRGYTFRVPNVNPLYLLILFSLLSFANSINLYSSVSGFAKIFTAVMSYVLVYNVVKSEDDAKKMLVVIVLATVIPMLVGYYQFFTESGGKGLEGEMNRVKGTLGLANAYGIYLALSLSAGVMLLLHPRWKINKYLLGAVVVSIIVSSIISLNRGTWIALSTGVLIASLFYIRKIRFRWIVLAAIAMAGVFSNLIIERFQQLHQGGYYAKQNTLEERIEFWKITIEYVPEHPIIGWGIGTAVPVMQAQSNVTAITHNDYLRLLLETGSLGLGAYLFFLGREAWQVFRRLRFNNLWHINYPMLITMIYFIIISLPQNIYDHMVNLPLFFSIVSIYHRMVGFEKVIAKEARTK